MMLSYVTVHLVNLFLDL
uniref:Uncharacterized protein n=1 Tax=Arundo donax TaxID=35708 RepID=A0A0A9CAS0_ARUDO